MSRWVKMDDLISKLEYARKDHYLYEHYPAEHVWSPEKNLFVLAPSLVLTRVWKAHENQQGKVTNFSVSELIVPCDHEKMKRGNHHSDRCMDSLTKRMLRRQRRALRRMATQRKLAAAKKARAAKGATA